MEQFQSAREDAKKNIKLADHMITVTYPLIKDSKLLLAVMENLFLAYTNAMSSILHYDRLFKRIPAFPDTFEGKFRMFRNKCMLKHNLSKNFANEIQDIREIMEEHRKSPVEFSRKDRFVICSDNYNMKSLSPEDIRRHIEKAKLFIQAMDNIVGKNDRLFR